MFEQFAAEVAELVPKVRAGQANVAELQRLLSKYLEVSNQERWPFVNARVVGYCRLETSNYVYQTICDFVGHGLEQVE